MSRNASAAALGQLAKLSSEASILSSCRFIGGGVPEFFGKKSAYTEGTDFLGTPKDHIERTHSRPLSPDVFTLDGKGLHYKLPLTAITSITNRVTGCAMYGGFAAAGAISLVGDLPGTVAAIVACGPLVTFPLKLAVSYPIVYHWMAGMRHLIWDHAKYGNQVDKTSYLELDTLEKHNKILLGSSAALSFILAMQ